MSRFGQLDVKPRDIVERAKRLASANRGKNVDEFILTAMSQSSEVFEKGERKRKENQSKDEIMMLVWIVGVLLILCLIGAGWEWVEKHHEEWTVIGIGLGIVVLVGTYLSRRIIWRGFVCSVRFFRRLARRFEEVTRP